MKRLSATEGCFIRPSIIELCNHVGTASVAASRSALIRQAYMQRPGKAIIDSLLGPFRKNG